MHAAHTSMRLRGPRAAPRGRRPIPAHPHRTLAGSLRQPGTAAFGSFRLFAARGDARAADGPPGGPAAVVTHRASPGLGSGLLKQALLNMAADLGLHWRPPHDRTGWAEVARKLRIRPLEETVIPSVQAIADACRLLSTRS